MRKLKLEQIEVVSFATAEAEEEQGTVEGQMVRTLPGQTYVCTACGMYQCA